MARMHSTHTHNHDGKTTQHIGVPGEFKPFRDRPVKASKVACPVCGAGTGEKCISQKGTPMTSYHPRRRGMAIRAGY